MKEIKILRDKISPQTILIGNGDIESLENGKEKIKKYGIDGIMIGRGIFKNP
jgi:tRNA-dihydrouridine synthase